MGPEHEETDTHPVVFRRMGRESSPTYVPSEIQGDVADIKDPVHRLGTFSHVMRDRFDNLAH